MGQILEPYPVLPRVINLVSLKTQMSLTKPGSATGISLGNAGEGGEDQHAYPGPCNRRAIRSFRSHEADVPAVVACCLVGPSEPEELDALLRSVCSVPWPKASRASQTLPMPSK